MRSELTPQSVGPFSRLVGVDNLPPPGVAVRIEAIAEEREALARDFALPALRSLVGEYRLTSSAKGVHVAGKVSAAITQTCVVTLEPFDSDLTEDVEVDFAEGDLGAAAAGPLAEHDPPDEIVNGQIDLGALTAEFLALGLDPYPRKPGVDFAGDDTGAAQGSPFAALGKLKGEG